MKSLRQKVKDGEMTFREALLEVGKKAKKAITDLGHLQTSTELYMALSERSKRWALLKARIDGFDVDNSPYLDGDKDEGSRIENMKGYNAR